MTTRESKQTKHHNIRHHKIGNLIFSQNNQLPGNFQSLLEKEISHSVEECEILDLITLFEDGTCLQHLGWHWNEVKQDNFDKIAMSKIYELLANGEIRPQYKYPGDWIRCRFLTEFSKCCYNYQHGKPYEEYLIDLQGKFYSALLYNAEKIEDRLKMEYSNTSIPELIIGEHGSRPGCLMFQFELYKQNVQVRAISNNHNGVSIFVYIEHKEDGASGAVYTDSPWGSNCHVKYVRECFYAALLEDHFEWE